MVRIEGDTAYLPNGQVLTAIHPATACEGRGCPLHHPSNHLMVDWPLSWRGDKGLMERTCPHGVGHDDPDDFEYRRSVAPIDALDYWGIHGCDGCCVRD